MLKLPSRETPMVTFRRALPDFLGPAGEGCFIEVEARAGGAMNMALGRAVENMLLRARVMDRKANKITDDEQFIAADHANVQSIRRDEMAALFDTCVIEWRSNIQVLDDKDQPVTITCNRENFLDLSEQRIPELAKVFRDLKAAVNEAGKILAEEDDKTEKN